jgi:cytochrome c peroxidase
LPRSGLIQATDNSPADAGATLGRVLFYDRALSLTQTVSCASCHRQDNGFTDGATLSQGHDGGLTGLHSMRLGNANFYAGEEMFWNRRAPDLEAQATKPIRDAIW